MKYFFGDFEFDDRLYELRLAGKLIEIEPKVFDLLAYLLHHRDRLVSKDELIEKVWRGQVISESTLAHCAAIARKAVRDDGSRQQVIKTQHGRGYHFVAVVTERAGESPDGAAPGVGDRNLLFQPSPPLALALPNKPSLAVLPFVSLSGDPKQGYFSDGMTEDLITDLSKLSGLFVVARSSVFIYKGKAVKVEEVSQELGVRYVLEGSVRKAGGWVRISAQLVDAARGGHLWAERFDRPYSGIFALQDEIRQKIVLALRVKLIQEEQERFRRAPTDNLEAYNYFLQGVEYYNRLTKEANIQAQRMFEKALELDPKYAAAYVALGFTRLAEWIFRWSYDSQSPEQASELVRRAIALDDSLSIAHKLLSHVYLWKKQYEWAIAEAERVISFAPNDAEGYELLGFILNSVGRPKDAIKWVEKAVGLNFHEPFFHFPPSYISLAIICSKLGREEEAWAEAVTVLKPISSLSPNLFLEVARQRPPYEDPAVLERVLNALRQAGLK